MTFTRGNRDLDSMAKDCDVVDGIVDSMEWDGWVASEIVAVVNADRRALVERVRELEAELSRPCLHDLRTDVHGVFGCGTCGATWESE